MKYRKGLIDMPTNVLHAALGLPDDVTIYGVWFNTSLEDMGNDHIKVKVRGTNEGLPLVEEGETIPTFDVSQLHRLPPPPPPPNDPFPVRDTPPEWSC